MSILMAGYPYVNLQSVPSVYRHLLLPLLDQP
ncbi:hypothetical protein ORF057 [Yersinia phage PYps49T]|nr:hypothetical protein ORF057 [Yersinia phage PYps49T]